jgi:hypothetical protein
LDNEKFLKWPIARFRLKGKFSLNRNQDKYGKPGDRHVKPDDAEVITLFYKAEQNLDEHKQDTKARSEYGKVRLHRARTRLKEKMEKNFSEEIKNIY